MPHIVYLGLGSNIGARHEMIEKAIELIAEQVGDIVSPVCSLRNRTMEV